MSATNQAPPTGRIRALAAVRAHWMGLLYGVLGLLHLVPVFSVQHLPTVDGPSHVYNAWVAKQLAMGSSGLVEQFFRIDWSPYPNWAAHAALSALMFFVEPSTAEKLLVAAILLLFLGAAWYLAGSIDRAARVYAFLAIPFAWNKLLQLGFYSFALGTAVCLFIIAFSWRRRDDWSWPANAKTGLLLLLCYFCHPLPAAVAIALLGAITIANWRKVRQRAAWTRAGAAAPAVILLVWFASSQKSAAVSSAISASDALLNLFALRILATVHPAQLIYGIALAAVFGILTVATLILRKGRLSEKDLFPLVALLFLFVYFAIPDTASGGTLVKARLALFPFLLLVPWFDIRLARRAGAGLAIAISLLTVANIFVITSAAQRNDRQIAEYLWGVRQVDDESTILPLLFDARPEGSTLPLLAHAAGYEAAERGLIDLSDYEPVQGYFPVAFRRDVSRADLWRLEASPGSVDLDALRPRYVYTWRMPPDAPVARRIAETYDLVSVTAEGRLYVRRGDDTIDREARLAARRIDPEPQRHTPFRAVLLYLAVSLACVAAARRWVMPISGRARIALILLPLCFTGRALLSGKVYAPIDLPYASQPLQSMPAAADLVAHNPILSDVHAQIIPWRAAVREAFEDRTWPLLNRHILCGDILQGAAQPAPYQPFFLASLALPLVSSLTFLAAIAFFGAAVSMFVFARDLELSEGASLIAAASWTYCAFVVFWIEWPMGSTITWAPLVMLGVRRVIRSPSRGAMLLLTLSFSLMLMSGHSESALHIVSLGAVYAVWELWVVRGRGFIRATFLATSAGVAALALCAIFILPHIEAVHQTWEFNFRTAASTVVDRSLPLARAFSLLAQQFVPFVWGYQPLQSVEFPPEALGDTAYTGSVATALALFALWRSREKSRWFFLALLIGGFLVGCGFPPFASWLGRVPLFDIALNKRMVFVAAVAMSVLAGMGADAVREKTSARDLALVAALLGGLLLLFVRASWRTILFRGLTEEFLWLRAPLLLAPLAILILLLLFQWRRGSHPAIVVASLLVLILGQRTAEMADFYPTLDAKHFYPPVPLFELTRGNAAPKRIVGWGDIFVPNMAALYGLEDARGYQAMTLAPLFETFPLWCEHQPVWFNRVDDLTRPFLSFLNVRYAIALGAQPAPEGWSEVGRDGNLRLLENCNVLDRFFVPRAVVLGKAVLEEFERQSDFSEVSWIETTAINSLQPNGPGRVTRIRDRNGGYELFVTMENEGWVIGSQAAWNGWRAYVDGRPVDVAIANHAFLAFRVPKGEHRVRVVYLPHSFVVGRAITLATIFFAGAGFAFIRREMLRKFRARFYSRLATAFER